MSNALTMTGRSLRLSARSPEALLTALLLPVMLMVVFVYLFGGAVSIGTKYVDYVAPGVLLLCAYSAGLGMPFILSGLAINSFFGASGRIRPHLLIVERVSGALLVAVGLLLVTDRLTILAQYFARLFPSLSTIG